MKTFSGLFLCLTSLSALNLYGAPSLGSQSTPISSSTAYAIVSNDANSRVWQRETYETLPSGQIVTNFHSYTELATGLNFKKNGKWVESKEEIDLLPNGGAAATNGQHQAYFPGDIYNGVIEMVTPDGEHLKSRPTGLAYFDGTNSVLIAELTNSIGVLVAPNQVLYPDAFTDFKADIRYTYTKVGLEQDIILREQPPAPESLGLNHDSARLEVLTEFFDPPQPVGTATTVATVAGNVEDDNLTFGNMTMGNGKAFMMGTNSPSVSVDKQWLALNGRQFLVEEVPVSSIADELENLPLPANQASSTLNTHIVSTHRILPAQRLVKIAPKTMLLAKASAPPKGLVLDYNAVLGTLTNYTFQGDTTYYISGTVNLYGTNTFEGGTVIKYTNSSSAEIVLNAGVGNSVWTFQSAPYRPAIFTTLNDNSVGDTIAGSTGNPAGTLFSHPLATYLCLPGDNGYPAYPIHDARFSYAQTAIYQETRVNCSPVEDCQFVHCSLAIKEAVTSLFGNVPVQVLHNVLISNGGGVMSAQGFSTIVDAENITADQVSDLFEASSANISAALTNCILTAVSHPLYLFSGSGTISYDHCAQAANGNGVYQTVGVGNYYLTAYSTNQNAGTTNIDPTLLASLAEKTTYPPIVLLATDIYNNIIFSPQIPRDTNSNPDLGYHYEPIDYAIGGASINNATATVNSGTVIAAFKISDGDSGLRLNSSAFICIGMPSSLNRIVEYATVQEEAGGWLAPTLDLVANSSSTIDCRFTDWSVLAQDSEHLNIQQAPLTLRDCQFHNGNVYIYYQNSDPTIANCLFERVNFILSATDGSTTSIQDSLFWRGTFDFFSINGYAIVQNNLFDQTTIPDRDASYVGGYNAFVTNFDRLQPESTNDLILASSPIYRNGPLGNFYQSAGNPLINAGSTNASQLGLYDYTVLTNLVSGLEIKETNSIVDIGYHYVALDTNGIPIDTYSNGIPDYFFTSSTAPLPDWWQLIYFGNLFQLPNGDYDNDGTTNLLEYLNGTDPNKISFSFSFANQYVSTNIISTVVTILGGVPSYFAVLVDSTNFSTATWTAYTSSNITVNLGSTQGSHDLWIGLRGLPANAQQTWEETTLILDSSTPTITITNPINNVSFNASRVDVSGNFTAVSLQQITVNGILAFVNGTNFEALNVPLNAGTNIITAIIEDLNGSTNISSINIPTTTNVDSSLNNPVQLQATPVAGFAPLSVTFSVQTNVPGTLQQVSYDFNGDDIADFVTNNLLSLTYTYATNGEYFPVVTLQTTAGLFSSIGGWNAVALDPSNEPVQINVQGALTQTVFVSITDPVDLKWIGTNLYVLSGSSGTITEFDTNADVISALNVAASSSGFDVDAAGNVYVALTASNQVWKFFPTNSSFQADTNFGSGGFIGDTNGATGVNNGQFNAPFDVAVSPDGRTISVSDSGNNRIQQFSATNGSFIVSFGTNGNLVGQFSNLKGLTYDSAGTLYVVDSGNDRIVLAQDSVVMGVTGTNGTALGQFTSPVNVSIDERGVYVADTGNNRVQKFNLLPNGQLFSITPANIGYAVSTNLNAPAAVAAVDSLTNETFYVADTGNNRIVLCTVAGDDPTPVWTNMTAHVSSGDFYGAMLYFSSLSADKYQQAFLSAGTADTISAISQIGTLTPVYVQGDKAEYYFQQVINGQTITFTVEFVKENGVWKIMEF